MPERLEYWRNFRQGSKSSCDSPPTGTWDMVSQPTFKFLAGSAALAAHERVD